MEQIIIQELTNEINDDDSGFIICLNCNSNREYLKFEKSIKKLVSKKDYYFVGKSKKKYFHTYTVYEEIQSIIGKNVDLYIQKMGLSPSRMSRPLESLSGERWRASLYIAELLNKKILLFPWIQPEIINMYSEIWLKAELQKMVNNKVKILIPTNFEKCTDGSIFSKVFVLE